MHEFIYPLRVYYEDTDFNGFVYFTNYLKYMERAATHLIADLGVKATDLIKMNTLIAVRSVKCDFLAPARLDEDIEVASRIVAHTEVTITWQHIVRGQQDKQLIYCHALVERVCINQQLFPIKLPANLSMLIKQFLI